MEQDTELRLAVGLLANVVNLAVASVADFAKHIPEDEVRAEVVQQFNELGKHAARVVAMFPTTFTDDMPVH